jgi:uncharacterized protein (DUF2164 family)
MKKLTKEMKTYAIQEIQQFFLDERGEEMGELAADHVLEFVKEKIAPLFYNQALSDAKVIVEQKMLSIEEDLYTLEKPIKR